MLRNFHKKSRKNEGFCVFTKRISNGKIYKRVNILNIYSLPEMAVRPKGGKKEHA